MRSRLPRTGRRPLSGRPVRSAVALVAVCVLAACGSGGDGGSGGGSGGAAAPREEIDVDPAAVQELVDRAFQADVAVDDLPATAQEAFQRATLELTPEQLDKAFECWEGASCEVGDGDVTLGIADGFGQNQWRRFTKMEIILQALTYPEVGRILSTDAQGDLTQMLSNVRSLAAQGARAIVTYNDFGAAAVPAYQAAAQQGAFVSSYVGGIPDAPTTAVHNQVKGDICDTGESMARVAAEDLGLTGTVAILNGTPGNPQGQTWNQCFEDALPSGLTVGTRLDTDWTPAGTFEAASALVSSGDDVAGIFYDYADPLPQVVQAYEQAGRTTPALVTWTSNNGLFKAWEERQGTPQAFDLFFTNGLNWQGRLSVTAVMDLVAGAEVDAELIMPQPFVRAEPGVYDPARPDDYPGPSILVPDELVDRMLQ